MPTSTEAASVADVLVLGKGPAALAAAAALAERGLRTAVLGPAGPVHWPAQYGAWLDELQAAGYDHVVQHVWPQAEARMERGRPHLLERAYVRVDRAALAERLLARCERGGVQWRDGEAAAVEHTPAHSLVRTREGAALRARVVVDASGHRPALVRRGESPPPGFQSAFGLTVEVEASPFAPGRALLMDWSDAGPDVHHGPPTFLYALPLSERLLFVEETALVARPAMPMPALQVRLRQRLSSLGLRPRRVLEQEQCWIPMGGPLPDLAQRVVGFGAAAGMVHPATGYLLARTLAAAPALAEALACSLGAPHASPRRAARAAWRALWPAERRRRHALFCFGMEVLLRLDAAETRAFFAAFFRLPPPDWQGFLSDTLPAARLACLMARVFRDAPALRRALAAPLWGPAGPQLAAQLLRSASA